MTGESEVKDAVTAYLADLGFPFEAPSDNPGRLTANRTAVGEWWRVTRRHLEGVR